MVRLKVSIEVCGSWLWIGFQFHNGSIKRYRITVSNVPNILFQFHNGSIKSVILNLAVIPVDEFQFHNGSIKSVIEDLFDDDFIEVSIPQWFD